MRQKEPEKQQPQSRMLSTAERPAPLTLGRHLVSQPWAPPLSAGGRHPTKRPRWDRCSVGVAKEETEVGSRVAWLGPTHPHL